MALIAGLSLFVLLVLGHYFLNEGIALAWHLQHGRHAELGGYRFKVPLLYYADDPNGLPVLSINKCAGRFTPGLALISIKFGRQIPVDGIRTHESQKGDWNLQLEKTAERSALLADRQGTCVEYITAVSNHPGDPREKVLLRNFNIRCLFGPDLGAEYSGTPKLKSDFYEMLRMAEHLKGKS